MKQEVIGNVTVVLDTEVQYSGAEKPNDEEKLVRKAIGLPVTKQLVYYADKKDAESVEKVVSYQLVELFDNTDRWYVIEVTTETGSTHRIHSGFLNEMQKPTFIEDMAAQNE